MKKIGVIGGGAAGLCAARHILARTNMMPIVWEQANKVGGTWIYTANTGTDSYGLPIHSSMYQNLKTNLPKEVMAFPDYPFPAGRDSFLHHTDVLQYLEDYTQHFSLLPHIKFSQHVEDVRPVLKETGPPSWEVKVKDLLTNESSTTMCDALFICNGHYSVPRIPNITNIDEFKGMIEHSHNYREPLPYKGHKVVVLGASASGLDIMLELASVASEVFLSHNLPVNIPSDLPQNVRQVSGVVSATDNGFILKDGTSVEADAILYCTGYEYTFPFLSDECGVSIEDNIVKPLYKHLIHSTYPSMAFIGIPFQICPFPLFDFQVQYFVAVLSGRATLPPPGHMTAMTAADLEQQQRKGYQDRHYHKLGLIHQLSYMEEWAQGAGASPPQPHLKSLFKIVMLRLALSLQIFKEYSYSVGQDGTVAEKREGVEVNTKLDLMTLVMRAAIYTVWNDLPKVITVLWSTLRHRLTRLFH